MLPEQSARLFKSDFWERLTHVDYRTPMFIYIPIIGVSLYFSIFMFGFGWALMVGGLIAGLLVWTLTEYVFHRFLFHFKPTSGFGKKLVYLFHGVHHDFPQEADRLVMPPTSSLPIAAFMFLLHYATAGWAALPVYTGFLCGYLYYEFVHYSVHFKRRKPLGWTEKQRKNHFLHHFRDPTDRYGVTSPLWDFIFGTYKKTD